MLPPASLDQAGGNRDCGGDPWYELVMLFMKPLARAGGLGLAGFFVQAA